MLFNEWITQTPVSHTLIFTRCTRMERWHLGAKVVIIFIIVKLFWPSVQSLTQVQTIITVRIRIWTRQTCHAQIVSRRKRHAQVRLWHRVRLNEHLSAHELLESGFVEARLNWGQLKLVSSKEFGLKELFAYFLAIPELKEVNDRDMVSPASVRWSESVSLKTLQLSSWTNRSTSALFTGSKIALFCVDQDLRFNSE